MDNWRSKQAEVMRKVQALKNTPDYKGEFKPNVRSVIKTKKKKKVEV